MLCAEAGGGSGSAVMSRRKGTAGEGDGKWLLGLLSWSGLVVWYKG